MEQNEEITAKFIDQEEFRNMVRRVLLKQVYEQIRAEPQLRELDAAIEEVELGLRKIVETARNSDTSNVPQHVIQNVDERISHAAKKNAALDIERYRTLSGKLEYFDLRELQDTITSKALWVQFESCFANKEELSRKSDQLAELRNGIRHSRAVSEIVRKEGEAAILWFKQVLNK